MDTAGRNGATGPADGRPDMKRIADEATRREDPFGSFGEYLDWFIRKLDLSENRVAELASVHVSVISRILHGKPAGDALMLRILVGLLGLSAAQLDFINLGLAADGRNPHRLQVPGRDIPSHEEHAIRKRGGVRGKRFGNRPTDAKERNGA